METATDEFDESKEAIVPTPERFTHGQIQQAKGPVKSDPGDYGAPHVAVDILESLLLRNSITKDEKLAGDRFRAWFQLAQLDTLKASDPSRVVVSGILADREPPFRVEQARNQVDKAIRWLGGLESSAGSCVWNVLGLDQSLRRWHSETSLSSRNLTRSSSTAILIMALERLARMPWRGPFEEKA
jgi:hypothetical protein